MENNIGFEILGYMAAIITNISIYPQVYKIYVIIKNKEYNKLNAISIYTYCIQMLGCSLYFIYSIVFKIYPIMLGCFLWIIPVTYIIGSTVYYKDFKDETIEFKNQYNIQNPNNIEIKI